MKARSTCSYTPMRTCYINRIHGGVYFLLTFTNYVYAKGKLSRNWSNNYLYGVISHFVPHNRIIPRKSDIYFIYCLYLPLLYDLNGPNSFTINVVIGILILNAR